MWSVTCLVVCWLLSPYSAFLISEKCWTHTTTTSTVTNCLLNLFCFRLAQGVISYYPMVIIYMPTQLDFLFHNSGSENVTFTMYRTNLIHQVLFYTPTLMFWGFLVSTLVFSILVNGIHMCHHLDSQSYPFNFVCSPGYHIKLNTCRSLLTLFLYPAFPIHSQSFWQCQTQPAVSSFKVFIDLYF